MFPWASRPFMTASTDVALAPPGQRSAPLLLIEVASAPCDLKFHEHVTCMDAHGQGFHHVRTQPLQQQGGRLPVTTQGEKMVETGHLRRKHMAGGQTAHMTGDHPFPAGTPETQSSVRSRQMAVEIEQHLVPYRGKKIFFRCLQDEGLCLSVEFPATGISFEQMGKLPQVLFFLGFPVCHDVPSHSKKHRREFPVSQGSSRRRGCQAGQPQGRRSCPLPVLAYVWEGQTRHAPRRQDRECPADVPPDGIQKNTLAKRGRPKKEKGASR